MDGKTHNSRTHRLTTATAAADPVLVRLRRGTHVTVLVAEDMTHTKAGEMELHDVRWVQSAHGLKNLLKKNPAGVTQRVLIKTNGKERVAMIPGMPYVRVPATVRGFRYLNLSHHEMRRYLAASDRRFLHAGKRLERVPSATLRQDVTALARQVAQAAARLVPAKLVAAVS